MFFSKILHIFVALKLIISGYMEKEFILCAAIWINDGLKHNQQHLLKALKQWLIFVVIN